MSAFKFLKISFGLLWNYRIWCDEGYGIGDDMGRGFLGGDDDGCRLFALEWKCSNVGKCFPDRSLLRLVNDNSRCAFGVVNGDRNVFGAIGA